MNFIFVMFMCIMLYSCNGKLRNAIEEDNFSEKNEGKKTTMKHNQFKSRTHISLNSKPQNSGISHVKEECSKAFINKVSHLLDIFNISVPFDDIENLRPSIKGKVGSGGKLSGLHFVIILNMRHMYSEYGDEEFKKNYEANGLTSELQKPLFLNNFEKHSINNIKLVLIVNNIARSNKSLIQIKMDVNFNQDYAPDESEKSYNFSKKLHRISPEISDSFIRYKRRWRKKNLKVEKFSTVSKYVGIALATLSSILCGLSFVLKKLSLMKMERNKFYYFDKNWWFGQSFMMIGDLLHFMAFYFAPAIIVCTLQIFTVIVTAVASSTILEEKMHKYGKLAFALSVSGCWVIVSHVPNEPHVYSIETFLYMLLDHVFLIYVAVLSIIIVLLTSFWIPKYGKINSLAYVVQCAIFGSIIVLGIKGIALGFTDTLSHWLPWVSFITVSVLILIQLEYLNKAISMYNTLVVTTQYYVLYSSLVIFSSSLLFKMWVTTSYVTIFTNFCGFSAVGLGALILTIFEEENATFNFSKLFAGPEIKHLKQ